MQKTDNDVKHDESTLREYLRRRHAIECDIAMLREDQKQLNDEFADKLDMKTLRLAIAVFKNQQKVAHQFTFETFMNVLEQEGLPTDTAV